MRLPPHTRGCTFMIAPPFGAGPASPAHAGMYPTSSRTKQRHGRFPRTRGDVPARFPPLASENPLPPHTRGCTFEQHHAQTAPEASPAHAGMYPTSSRTKQRHGRFPRTRGDVPARFPPLASENPLPPHTRGCTFEQHHAQTAPEASPAHAGMYPTSSRTKQRHGRFPRTRGDVPARFPPLASENPLPPHTRGCTFEQHHAQTAPEASPAHAGMYLPDSPPWQAKIRFPRTRGDVPLSNITRRLRLKLPPHTRGCTCQIPPPGKRKSASPAHAGMYL